MCGCVRADLDVLEKLQRVVDLAGVARGDVLTLAQVRADGEEHGVEAARRLLGHQVLDLVIEDDLDAQRRDAGDFGVEHLARQAVLRDAEMHHAARQRPRFVDHDRMTAPRQVPRDREAARAGADDEHALAGGRRVRRDRPAFRERPCRRGTARRRGCSPPRRPPRGYRSLRTGDSRHARAPPACGLSRTMISQACAIAAGLRLGEPGLDVFAGRARVDCTAAGGRRRAAASCGPATRGRVEWVSGVRRTRTSSFLLRIAVRRGDSRTDRFRPAAITNTLALAR